jgi:hypothetical protein
MESSKQTIHDAAVELFEEVKDAVSSAESREVVLKTVGATLAAVEKVIRSVSPSFAVPFEELAFDWLEPKLKALVEGAIISIDPTPDLVSPVDVVDADTAAAAIADSIKAEVK